MGDKDDKKPVRITKLAETFEKTNPLLDRRHLDAFARFYYQSFGEKASKAYGQGIEGYEPKLKNALLRILDKSSHFRALSKKTQSIINKAAKGDSLRKDLAMVILQPIGLAIEGSIQMLLGLATVMMNIGPALKKEDDGAMLLAMSRTWLGVIVLLLAAVAPLARLYNTATRAYASVTFDESKEALLEEELAVSEMDDDECSSVYSESESQAESFDEDFYALFTTHWVRPESVSHDNSDLMARRMQGFFESGEGVNDEDESDPEHKP